MTKEQVIYDLAREIFLRKLPHDYLHDQSRRQHEVLMDNAIAVAKMFYAQVEKDEQSRDKK